jgi:hypothetical protein
VLKRPALLVASCLTAALGGALLILDLWVLAAVWAANYRRWPAHGRSEPAHPWFWLGILPLTAALLIYGGYALHKLSRRLGDPEPQAPTDGKHR